MMDSVEYFINFLKADTKYNYCEVSLFPKEFDVGGGKISIQEIDVLKNYPKAKNVSVTGLNQETFEYFIKTYGKQLRAIKFFKNKMVSDWSLLGTLPQLEYVDYFFNQRIEKLWDMSKNVNLKGLRIRDFSRLKSIEGIENASNLECFYIGNAVWNTMTIDSLTYLKNLNIKYLSFSGKSILDNDYSVLSNFKNLKVFDCATNLLTTEQVAWIVANFPNTKGYALAPLIKFSKDNEVLIVGKRKPFLKVNGNEERIKKYVENFNNLVEKYRGIPYDKCF